MRIEWILLDLSLSTELSFPAGETGARVDSSFVPCHSPSCFSQSSCLSSWQSSRLPSFPLFREADRVGGISPQLYRKVRLQKKRIQPNLLLLLLFLPLLMFLMCVLLKLQQLLCRMMLLLLLLVLLQTLLQPLLPLCRLLLLLLL